MNQIVPIERGIPVAWLARPLNVASVQRREIEVGSSLQDIFEEYRDELPPDFETRGIIRMNDVEVDRALWPRVRPRKRDDMDIVVTMHMPMQGGDNTVTLVASIAVAIVATLIAGPAGGLAAGALGLSTTGAAATALGALAATAVPCGGGLTRDLPS